MKVLNECGACILLWVLSFCARDALSFLCSSSIISTPRSSTRSHIHSASPTDEPPQTRKRVSSKHHVNGDGFGSKDKRADTTKLRRVSSPQSHGLREMPPGADDPFASQDADMHVLVPSSDVLHVSFSDLSQAAADTLIGCGIDNDDDSHKDSGRCGAGGDSKIVCRVAMDRFCRTLESVHRTEFMTKVDEAKAAYLRDSRYSYGNRNVHATTSNKKRPGLPPLGLPATRATMKRPNPPSVDGPDNFRNGDKDLSNAYGLKKKLQRLRAGWWKPLTRKQEAGEEKPEQTVGTRPDALHSEGRTREVSQRSLPPTSKRVRGAGDARHRAARAPEEECLPMLELVEDLLKNGMFNPISERDVMISQALAAEFPSSARVRPIFRNMANIYELLHEGPPTSNSTSAYTEGQQPAVPFDGRLLMFKRGNGMEETRGRLLLKKLDYVQSNAVRWLSQSLTDSIKRKQEQAAEFLRSCARKASKRTEATLQAFVEGAVDFGLERETIARFIEVADATEPVMGKGIDVASRNNARRTTVSLRRYGTRDVHVELEEFAEGGSWPPGDDSWFWDSRKRTFKDADISSRRAFSNRRVSHTGAGEADDEVSFPGKGRVRAMVLPRLTLGSVLGERRAQASGAADGGVVSREDMWDKSNTTSSAKRRAEKGASASSSWARSAPSTSMFSRLFSKCTIKEPTYEEVVVVYYKKKPDRFRPPKPLTVVWGVGKAISRVFSPGSADSATEKQRADLETQQKYGEKEGMGLGLQLRVYRGVPLVSLDAVTPEKKVEIRPQTALRLDLTTLVGLILVLANLRFDSPVLVGAATVSVVLFVIRAGFGYINTRIRVESFVSRDILAKTMGSNVPVLRHLAEEAAQQKTRHIALVYAALLKCGFSQGCKGAGDSGEGTPGEWTGARGVISIASVSRHCDVIMKACVGLGWEAEVDVRYWLRQMETLKLLIRADGDSGTGSHDSRSLLLVIEGPERLNTTARDIGGSESLPPAASYSTSTAESPREGVSRAAQESEPNVVFYRLLTPDAASEELRRRWAELVEPPHADVVL